jgi:hypothetical protein
MFRSAGERSSNSVRIDLLAHRLQQFGKTVRSTGNVAPVGATGETKIRSCLANRNQNKCRERAVSESKTFDSESYRVAAAEAESGNSTLVVPAVQLVQQRD